jgi:AcrR family transcriptional regulator
MIKNADLIETRRMQIATGASKLFIRKGYFKTNMRDISKATCITIGSLYDYIKKKEDILVLVFDVFQSQCEQILRDSGVLEIEDPIEQLKAAIETFLNIGATHRDMVILMYSETKSLPAKPRKAMLERESTMVKNFELIMQKGVEKGVFRKVDAFFTANIIYYLLSLEPLRGWNLKGHYNINEIHHQTIDFILNRIVISSTQKKTL